MATVINDTRSFSKVSDPIALLSEILPYGLYAELLEARGRYGHIEEVRCRRGRRVFITTSEGNIELSYILGGRELDSVTDKLCGGSLYAHRDTLAEGYITIDGGIRVGVVGRAAVENNGIIGIYDISGLNIRMPRVITDIGEPICRLLRENRGEGVLIYSPPGVGKTTLLRSVAVKMSSGRDARRVCVVDTRGEIGIGLDGQGLSLDLLLGYPRDKGIEIGTRTMNAELIICDEISGEGEASSIVAAQNCGTPLVATAHSADVSSLLRRRGFDLLHRAAVFGYYVGIRRTPRTNALEYDIVRREDADDLL